MSSVGKFFKPILENFFFVLFTGFSPPEIKDHVVDPAFPDVLFPPNKTQKAPNKL